MENTFKQGEPQHMGSHAKWINSQRAGWYNLSTIVYLHFTLFFCVGMAEVMEIMQAPYKINVY